MSCNKSLSLVVAFGISIGGALQAVQAATPSMSVALAGMPVAPTTSASHVVANGAITNATRGSALFSPTTSQAQAPQPGSGAATNVARDDNGLTLQEIDQMARRKVAQNLRGSDVSMSAPKSGVSLSTPAPASKPAGTLAPAFTTPQLRARTQPVTFIGAYSDGSGQHVLYDYRGAVYPARVGEKLLNGWVARKVNGLVVTVAEGRKTWTESMSTAGQETQAVTGQAVPLADLASPLPPGFAPGSLATMIGR